MLILAATPIGNLGDASNRLIEVLSTADVIAAEDTRTTKRLLAGLGIQNRPSLVSVHEHNERFRAPDLAVMAADRDVVLISDAGMPTISDPGFPVVGAAIAAGVPITAVPGPSAVTMALALSGLPTDRYCFEGFVPRKSGERGAVLRELARERRTLIFFESPARLAQTLKDVVEVMGADRPVVVCRELTKIHEEVRRGVASELAEWAQEGVRGEIVFLVGGFAGKAVDRDTALREVLALHKSGTPLKEAASTVAENTGHGRRDLYEAALRTK